MPIDFPNTPTNGQVYTSGNRQWTYNSTLSSWEGGLNTVTGTMASQNANGVNITGGTITGLSNLTTNAANITGNLSASGVATLSALKITQSGFTHTITTYPGFNNRLSFQLAGTKSLTFYNSTVGVTPAIAWNCDPSTYFDIAPGGRVVVFGDGTDLWVGGTSSDFGKYLKLEYTSNKGLIYSTDSDIALQHTGSYNVGVGTNTPAYKLDVNGTFNASGNATIGGTLITTNNITGNGTVNKLPNQYSNTSDSILTPRQLMSGGNKFRQLVAHTTQNNGVGASAGGFQTFGAYAQINTTVGSTASFYIFDGILSHTGYSGASLRNDREIDLYLHGVMLRVEANTNWIMRINFGVGSASRTPPLSGSDPSSGRQWGIEFYYDSDAANIKGRMYWYDTVTIYGTPFIIPGLTAANWTGMVYSIRMRQTATGLLEFYINTPVFADGGGDLPSTPTASMQATWTSTTYFGRHINFECATTPTTAPTTQVRIHTTAMYVQCKT